MEAGSEGDAVASRGGPRDTALHARVLRGEGLHRRDGWVRQKWRAPRECGNFEVRRREEWVAKDLPSLSVGPVTGAVLLPIEESESVEDEVLLIGGLDEEYELVSVVRKVDLATGVCSLQDARPHLLFNRCNFAAAQLGDGRVFCAGGFADWGGYETSEVLEQNGQGSPDEAWHWRQLPYMSVKRDCRAGCVLSDGRFAVFGGYRGYGDGARHSSCEVLTPMVATGDWTHCRQCTNRGTSLHAVRGCVVVAGGNGSLTAEAYEEALGRWRRLPCNLLHEIDLSHMGGVVM